MLCLLSDRKPDSFPEAVAPLVIAPRSYITRPADFPGNARVLNLAADCSYLGLGYYASLLAEARGHRVMPSVEAIVTLNRKAVRQLRMRGLNDALRRRLATMPSAQRPDSGFELFIAFGSTPDTRFSAFARQVFEAFHFPLLLLTLEPGGQGAWRIKDIEPQAPRDLTEEREAFFQVQLVRYLRGEWTPPKPRKAPRYTVAILHDPDESLPPSDDKALGKFVKAAEKLGMGAELITRKDFRRLAEYDALFIRETTNVNHHTFTFARKAEEEGMPVMDDPQSILRCTNKVYLAELLTANAIPAPETRVLDRRLLKTVDRHIAYPIVLKVPDGSFSRGVVKVDNRDELLGVGQKLLASSDLILAQEFMPTAYDWRVGVLDGQPLYVCQYLMSRAHWQIVNHGADGSVRHGGWKTLDVDDTPAEVIALALRAAALMGNGLYGVDIKQTDKGCVVIEVNDNPSLDSGVEDQVLKGLLYEAVMGSFLARLEAAHD